MRPPSKRTQIFDVRFWLPTGIALLALALSGGTAYYTIVRQLDRVSMIIRDLPIAFRVSADKLVLGTKDITIAFVNSGNRPALIFAVNVWVIQSDELGQGDCTLAKIREVAELETSFDPTVIKQGEFVSKTIRITGDPFSKNRPDKNTGALNIDVAKELRSAKEVSVEVCFMVSMATASKKMHRTSISAFKYKAAVAKGGMGMNVDFDNKRLTDPRPYILVDESRTIFDRD